MPTLLGKTISADTVARIVAAYSAGLEDDLTPAEVQDAIRQGVVTKVKKFEKAQAIAAADHESDFDLV